MPAAKFLLTGASGCLASAFIPLLQKRGDIVIATDVVPPESLNIAFQSLDISQDRQVSEVLSGNKPDIVLHLAAETDVDRCETDPERAFRINETGTSNIASVCRDLDIPMVYISTGEVFDGEKNLPYRETDPTGPINVYAQSKLKGENAVRSALSRFFIVRTGWLFGGGKKDRKFVGKMVNLLKTEKNIKAVNDKYGSPTYIKDLARNTLKLVDSGKYGLFHMCNKGFVTRYDMTLKIAEILGRNDINLVPVSSDSFRAPAKRGRSEALENYNLGTLGMDFMPAWEKSLEEYLQSGFLPEAGI